MARVTSMRPSSSGWRSASSTERREGADLVEEEHAVVGEAHLPGARQPAAPHQPGRRHRVVRRAEGPLRHQRTSGVEQPGHRVDAGDGDGLVDRQRGEDPRQAPREHGLPRPRGAGHEDGVASGRGDLEGTPGRALPAHLGEVGPHGAGARGEDRLDVEARQVARDPALQQVDRGAKGGRPEHLQPRHEPGLGGVPPRNHQPPPAGTGRVLGHGERARHRPQRAVQRQLPHRADAHEGRRRHLSGRGQGRQGDQALGHTVGVPTGLYLRISRDDGETTAVERQRADCLALAAERGWEVGEEYVDADVSAFSGVERPAFQRLLEDMEAGAID